jgi:ankyrin repeat protein
MAKRDRDGDEEMAVTADGGLDEAAMIEAFLVAVKAGDVETVRSLLAQDADLVHLEDHDTLWSPLHHAVKGGYVDIVRELLKRGADVGAKTHHDSTPLHIAACNAGPASPPEMVTNLERIVTLLIDRGTPLEALDNKQNTPMHRAAQHGSLGILRTLLLLVGDHSSKNADGQSIADRAMQSGHEAVINLIKQGVVTRVCQ